MTNSGVRALKIGSNASMLVAEGETSFSRWAHVKVDSTESLAKILAECTANQLTVMVGLPRTLPELTNSSMRNRDVVFIDLSALDKVVEHSVPDQVISVQTGMRAAELAYRVREQDSDFPYYGADSRTVCDVINTGDIGPFEQSCGGMRHLVLGLEVALTDGRVIRTGGKVVKNVTGYDTTKLFVGSRGTLGIPCVAHIRLSARPKSIESFIVGTRDLSEAIDVANAFLQSGLPLASLDICSASKLRESELNNNADVSRVLSADCQNILSYSLAEHHEVIEEVKPILEQIATAQRPCSMVDTKTLLELLQVPPQYVEMSCAPGVVPKIVSALKDFLKIESVTARPGAGRLRAVLRTGCEVDTFVRTLQQVATKIATPITCAVVAEDSYRVFHAPEEHSPSADLVASIKSKFDPNGCLNPFANFIGR